MEIDLLCAQPQPVSGRHPLPYGNGGQWVGQHKLSTELGPALSHAQVTGWAAPVGTTQWESPSESPKRVTARADLCWLLVRQASPMSERIHQVQGALLGLGEPRCAQQCWAGAGAGNTALGSGCRQRQPQSPCGLG